MIMKSVTKSNRPTASAHIPDLQSLTLAPFNNNNNNNTSIDTIDSTNNPTARTNINSQPQPQSIHPLSLNNKQWLIEYNKLRHKELLSDKDIIHSLTAVLKRVNSTIGTDTDTDTSSTIAVSDSVELQQLLEYNYQLTSNRLNEQKMLNSDIRKIKQYVSEFKSQVQAIKSAAINSNISTINTNKSTGPESIKLMNELLDRVEDSLELFKSAAKQQYLSMQLDEKELELDSANIQQKIDRWMKEDSTKAIISHSNSIAHSTDQQSNINNNNNIPAVTESTAADSIELRELDALIARDGGSTGNWSSDDHNEFLRLRTKISNDSILINRLCSEISELTPPAVLTHIDWYKLYLQRQQQRKILIKQWKLIKQQQQQKLFEQQELAESEQQKSTKSAAVLEQERIEREQRAAAITEWKLKKQLEQSELIEKQRRSAAETERLKRERASEESEQKKLALQTHKQSLAAAAAAEAELLSQQNQLESDFNHQRQQEIKQRLINQHQQYIEKTIQNRQAVAESIAAAEQRKQQLLAQSQSILQYNTNIERDPNRLISATQTQLQRERELELDRQQLIESKKLGKTGNLLHYKPDAGRKATPGWRKT